jgi:hypothetical protein
MANEFKNRSQKGLTSANTTPLYQTPDGKTSIMLELDIANTTSNVVEASVQMLDKSVNANYATGGRHIVKNAPVPAGGSLMVIAGQKIVLEAGSGATGDEILVTSSSSSASLDVVAAILEDVN